MSEHGDKAWTTATSDAVILHAVQAFQEGDAAAFDTIHRIAWPAVYNRARKMGLPHDEAEDIAQKVTVRVYLKAPEAEFVSRQQLWAWIFTIATREVYKAWQVRRPELFGDDVLAALTNLPTESSSDPSTAAVSGEELRDVAECLSRLDEPQRLVLGAVLVMNLTFRQAAAVCGKTLGQFKHRYELALRRVRECMKRKGHDVE